MSRWPSDRVRTRRAGVGSGQDTVPSGPNLSPQPPLCSLGPGTAAPAVSLLSSCRRGPHTPALQQQSRDVWEPGLCPAPQAPPKPRMSPTRDTGDLLGPRVRHLQAMRAEASTPRGGRQSVPGSVPCPPLPVSLGLPANSPPRTEARGAGRWSALFTELCTASRRGFMSICRVKEASPAPDRCLSGSGAPLPTPQGPLHWLHPGWDPQMESEASSQPGKRLCCRHRMPRLEVDSCFLAERSRLSHRPPPPWAGHGVRDWSQQACQQPRVWGRASWHTGSPRDS